MCGLRISELTNGGDHLPRHTQTSHGLVPGNVGKVRLPETVVPSGLLATRRKVSQNSSPESGLRKLVPPCAGAAVPPAALLRCTAPLPFSPVLFFPPFAAAQWLRTAVRRGRGSRAGRAAGANGTSQNRGMATVAGRFPPWFPVWSAGKSRKQRLFPVFQAVAPSPYMR
jgi:hypothetical protein